MRRKVKETIDNEIRTYLAGRKPPVPFYDSDNVQASMPTDDLWVSTLYYVTNTITACYAHEQSLEYGTIIVAIFGRAGTGTTAAFALADKIQDHFRQYVGTTVEIIGTLSASEASNGDAAGNFYAVDVELTYLHTF